MNPFIHPDHHLRLTNDRLDHLRRIAGHSRPRRDDRQRRRRRR